MLRFSTMQPTLLRVGTLLVLPNGTLEIGTASAPVAPTSPRRSSSGTSPLNTSVDPDQFGTGLLSVDGTVTIHGALKTPTFVRTATEPRAGAYDRRLASPYTAGARRPDLPARHAAGA